MADQTVTVVPVPRLDADDVAWLIREATEQPRRAARPCHRRPDAGPPAAPGRGVLLMALSNVVTHIRTRPGQVAYGATTLDLLPHPDGATIGLQYRGRQVGSAWRVDLSDKTSIWFAQRPGDEYPIGVADTPEAAARAVARRINTQSAGARAQRRWRR